MKFLVRDARSGRSSLARDSPPADVASAKTLRPADAVDGLIGTRLRLAYAAAARADIEHAAAIGEDAIILADRPGVENFDALDLGCFIQSLNRRAFAVGAGVAFGRHHHR